MNRPDFLRLLLAVLVGLFGGCGGCIWEHEQRQKADLGVAPSTVGKSAAYRDTIGSLSFLEGAGPLSVRGYGLVVGLGRNGSRDCPRNIRDQLVQRLYKRHRFTSGVVGVRNITPEQLIDDLDTAVVQVQGEIPPAAVIGSVFDVAVRALPGTQTSSLRGGRLFTADLEVFRSVSPGRSITGQALARASGPVFLNPFSEGESATKSNPMQGVVLAGGRVTQDRHIRLVLLQPSHAWARKIQARVNARFPSRYRVADAISPSFVRIRVPQDYHDDTAHFLVLLRSVYVPDNPQFAEARARLLGEEILRRDAPHARIALCFEGLGRTALPVLNTLYAHSSEYVSFHAAVAGLRLEDHLAGDAVAMHARNPAGEHRFQAIRALGEAVGMANAATALRSLLSDEDLRVQIAAYEALVKRGDVAIESKPIGGDNFILDRVPTERPGFVHVKRSGSRRIALFGHDLRCLPPVLYRAPDGSLTITADTDAEQLTLLRQVVSTGSVSPPIPASPALPELIELMGSDAGVGLDGEVLGLGLDYGAVVRALHHLGTSESMNAKFILEQPNVAELFGPARPAGRPESEL